MQNRRPKRLAPTAAAGRKLPPAPNENFVLAEVSAASFVRFRLYLTRFGLIPSSDAAVDRLRHVERTLKGRRRVPAGSGRAAVCRAPPAPPAPPRGDQSTTFNTFGVKTLEALLDESISLMFASLFYQWSHAVFNLTTIEEMGRLNV
ncbi:hypothetical protein EVAR_40070_1 [Eumeta japonica]|uniref:Uncharacterized protein n=1 Tax=Eumeta variegata TaxID=151549 RepID=A0A4C1X3H4_EUMVA|nr:hypothetical protein EVAR_40070_1 [Eumeta japonica]